MILLLQERLLTIKQKDNMRIGAILESAIEIITYTLSFKKKINFVLRNYIRKNKFIGAKDKKILNDIVFGYLKSYFHIKNICKKEKIKFSIRNSLLIYFFYSYSQNNLDSIYDGKYSISPNKDDENIFKLVKNLQIDIIPAFPEWIKKKVYLVCVTRIMLF